MMDSKIPNYLLNTIKCISRNAKAINEGQIVWNMVYKGLCVETNMNILAIE